MHRSLKCIGVLIVLSMVAASCRTSDKKKTDTQHYFLKSEADSTLKLADDSYPSGKCISLKLRVVDQDDTNKSLTLNEDGKISFGEFPLKEKDFTTIEVFSDSLCQSPIKETVLPAGSSETTVFIKAAEAGQSRATIGFGGSGWGASLFLKLKFT